MGAVSYYDMDGEDEGEINNEFSIFYDKKQIKECREREGLSPIKRGKRKCLNCDNEFISADIKKNRLCSYCRRVANSEDFEELPLGH